MDQGSCDRYYWKTTTIAELLAIIPTNEGDLGYSLENHRMYFWDGSEWRQIRFQEEEMPITFEDILQTVINTVRDREQALQLLREAQAKIAELESKINVREPDKKTEVK